MTITTDGPKISEVEVDANGNKIKLKDNTETIIFNYYASGLLKETVYGNHVVEYNYDGWGRNIYMKDPSVSQTPYTNIYNNYGELKTATTPLGTTTITYSPTGRVLNKSSVGQNTDIQTTYTYSPVGLLLNETGTSNSRPYSYTNTYNSLSQLVLKKEITPDNLTNLQTLTYDNLGRIRKEQTSSYKTDNPNANNGNPVIEYGYNTYNGKIEQYKDVATNTILWKLNSATAKMQTLTGTFGNGINVTNTYDDYDYVEKIDHTDGTNVALKLEYEFKANRGTLISRTNEIPGVLNWAEQFDYDDFERLTTWSDPNGSSHNDYETDGRIKQNNAVGNYNYEGQSRYGRTSADLNSNGDLHYLTRCPQIIAYNMFKNPVAITETTRGGVLFDYNISGERSKSSIIAEDGTTIIKNKFYSGITEVEVIEKPNQNLQFITYIAGSPYDAVVALDKNYFASGSSYSEKSYEYIYLHRDYQGTILAISGDNGAIKERRIFDPWGNLKKKFIVNTAVPDNTLNDVDFELLTDRGYTGHEHFFSVGIIHMNGRIYDPMLRTFLSPDPYIQQPENSQNYNRYTYCLNNPLLYTDPSGNVFVTATFFTSMAIAALIGGVAYVGMSFYTGSFSWGGLAKSIIVGAMSGAASYGIGEIIQSAGGKILEASAGGLTKSKISLMLMLPQAAMHGVAQGFIQGITGGSFEQSFLTASISSVAAGAYGMSFSDAKSGVGQVLFGTFAGGATASLVGGNFWEGAVSGMIVSWLNHATHKAVEKYRFNKELQERFKAGNVNPNGKPDLSLNGALNLNKNVEGLEQAYNDGGRPNIRFDIKSNKFLGLTEFGDVNLNPSKITNNLKFAALLFHEYRHAWQYASGNYYYWADKYGYEFVENYQERDAYWFQIKMGAGSFFDAYSRYADNRNLTKGITYIKK